MGIIWILTWTSNGKFIIYIIFFSFYCLNDNRNALIKYISINKMQH